MPVEKMASSWELTKVKEKWAVTEICHSCARFEPLKQCPSPNGGSWALQQNHALLRVRGSRLQADKKVDIATGIGLPYVRTSIQVTPHPREFARCTKKGRETGESSNKEVKVLKAEGPRYSGDTNAQTLSLSRARKAELDAVKGAREVAQGGK